MDVKQATALAESFFPDPKAKLDGGKIDDKAIALADKNDDHAIDKQELIDALVADKVKIQGGKVYPSAAVATDLFKTQPDPKQTGLAPRPWFQAPATYGGGQAPPAVRAIGSEWPAGTGHVNSNYTYGQIMAMKSTDFGTLAGKLKSPADVAMYLGVNVPYDDSRLDDAKGNLGSWSSDEFLKLGTGVCRDQHAFARDVINANGGHAVLLGYAASDQSHAVTAYQDKTTGKWGILEYGTLYPPEQLQADTPEEALMMVRPATLSITTFNDGGPHERSHVNGIIYTPASRVYEDFMRGPSLAAGTGVQITNNGITGTVSSNDRHWQGQAQIVTNPRLPFLKGAVMAGVTYNFTPDANGGFRLSAGGGYVPNNTENKIGSNDAEKKGMGFGYVAFEEYHPELVKVTDIKGSGINVTVGSHTTAQAMVGTGRDGDGKVVADIEGTSAGVSSLKWNPTVTVDRGFSLWHRGAQDTKLSATYGLGVDGGLLGAHYATGGRSLPINQYVLTGIQTQPTSWLGINAQAYVPLQNVSNDYAAKPLGRLELATPYFRVGTTQGKDQAAYDLSASLSFGKKRDYQVGVFAGVMQNKTAHQTIPTVGVQFKVLDF